MGRVKSHPGAVTLAPAAPVRNVSPLVSQTSPRALVVLRVSRGAGPPSERDIRARIDADRARLGLPPDGAPTYRLAGPYAIELGGQALDEYVAWET